MRKFLIIIALMGFTEYIVIPNWNVFSKYSTDNEFERDVKKMASLFCEMNNFMTEENSAKINEFSGRLQSYADEMKKKYGNLEDHKEMKKLALELIKKELEKCEADYFLKILR